jgi:hypothetical protein
LERERAVSPQVIKHLTSHHSVGRDEVAQFLAEQLPTLEDFEIDLILSPLFTPGLADQAVVAAILERDSIPASAWPALIQSLVTRPTRAHLVWDGGAAHAVVLREVTVARWVERLRLDGTIAPAVFELITTRASSSTRATLLAVARRATWEAPGRQKFLQTFWEHTLGADASEAEDSVELLRLAETYAPADAAEVLNRIPQWEQAVRREIGSTVSPKPFFHDRIEEMHGGSRDSRRTDSVRLAAKERELEFLQRLARVLAA